jgi:hypothetical protein
MSVWDGTISGNQKASLNWDAVTHFHEQWPLKFAPLGMSAYYIGIPYLLNTHSKVTLLYPNATGNFVASLQSLADPLLTRMNTFANGFLACDGKYGYYEAYHLVWTSNWNWTSSKWSVSADDSNGFEGNGMSKLITSWLWDEKALQHPNLKQVLMDSFDNQTLMYQDFTAGPGTWKPPFSRGGGNAINSGWRKAIFRPAAEENWDGLDHAKLAKRVKVFAGLGKALRDHAPHLGTYPNEADIHTSNAQRPFFGSNLPRLLSIKKKIDPYGLFGCKTCVGSEQWTETPDGELCLN